MTLKFRALRALAIVVACGFFFPAVIADDDGGASSPTVVVTKALDAREQAFHVLNRLAFGAEPGQVDELEKNGWKQWVEQQLDPQSIDDSACDDMIAPRCPSMVMTMTEAYNTYWPNLPEGFDEYPQEEKDAFFAERNRLRYRIQEELRESVLYRAIYSKRQLQEVMVDFWRNHFNVDQTKDNCVYFSNNYETEVIRKHVFGRFEDMLMASAKHPAMLIYLDNDASQKPLTKREKRQLELLREAKRKNPNTQVGSFGRNLERHTGVNENYARELMELHTLGVDRFYKQKDVYEVARALTGWTHGWNGEMYEGEYGFEFRQDVHDMKSKNIIGTSLSGRSGIKEGEDVVRMLAKHPGTAEFIAWKLCRYLINDEPSLELVERVAGVFRKTKGRLPEVYRAVIYSPEFMARESYRAKFKSPFEYVVSAFRATNADVSDPRETLYSLRRMGQPLCQCVDPTGYFDQTESWLDPGVLVHRWDFALRLTETRLKGAKMDREFARSLEEAGLEKTRKQITEAIVPGGFDKESDTVLARAMTTRRILALALGSPEFQAQ